MSSNYVLNARMYDELYRYPKGTCESIQFDHLQTTVSGLLEMNRYFFNIINKMNF